MVVYFATEALFQIVAPDFDIDPTLDHMFVEGSIEHHLWQALEAEALHIVALMLVDGKLTFGAPMAAFPTHPMEPTISLGDQMT